MKTLHTYREVSKDEATIHNWYSSVVGLAFSAYLYCSLLPSHCLLLQYMSEC